MNERLEKEIERFLHSEESTTYISSGTFMTAHKDAKKIARHFYNFALQDIRQVVETSKKNDEKLEHIANQEENLIDFIKYCNRIPVYNEILDRIDALMEE